MKKHLLHILTLFLAFTSIHAQDIKYEDLYKQLPTMKPNQGLFMLLNYQKSDPYFVNTYLQIGNVCEKQLKTIDALRNIDQAIFWANNASLYYNIYPNFAKKGDVSRDREFYANLNIPYAGKKLTDEEATNYVSARLSHYDEYKKQTTLIYNTLEKSKEHYNEAIFRFTHLNNEYENMNELLLHTDDSLLLYIDAMHFEFQSFEQEFDTYKKLIEKYPLGDYNQEYKLKRIETYRLNGLTSSDFLQNEFTVWDYDYWVKDYINVYKNDILTLRKEISDIQSQYDDNKIFLDKVDTVSTKKKFETYDDLFFLRLGRYDNYSLIKDLFRYMEIRQKFFIYGNSPISNPSDSSLALKNTKLRFFYNLTLMEKGIKNELSAFKKSISIEKVNRFKAFFQEYYNGEEGLMDFAESEPHVLYECMQTDFKKLKSYYINQDSSKSNIGYIPYKTDSIALFVNKTDCDSINNSLKYLTTHIQYLQGRPTYLGGVLKSKKRNLPFIARINPDTTISWIKTIKSDSIGSDQCIHNLYGYSSGISAIMQSGQDSLSALMTFSIRGEAELDQAIKDSLSPCLLKFDELTQNYFYVMAQKDTTVVDSTFSKEIYNTFNVYFTDSLGIPIWKNTIETKGTFVDAKRNGNNIQAYVNSINDFNKWELSVSQIDSTGALKQTFTVPSIDSYSIKETYNASSTNINLVGFFGKNPDVFDGNLVYIIIDDKGRITYDNLPY